MFDSKIKHSYASVVIVFYIYFVLDLLNVKRPIKMYTTEKNEREGERQRLRKTMQINRCEYETATKSEYI